MSESRAMLRAFGTPGGARELLEAFRALDEETQRLEGELAEATSILCECRDMGSLYPETTRRLSSFLRRQEDNQ